jgi:hypothetical protein
MLSNKTKQKECLYNSKCYTATACTNMHALKLGMNLKIAMHIMLKLQCMIN